MNVFSTEFLRKPIKREAEWQAFHRQQRAERWVDVKRAQEEQRLRDWQARNPARPRCGD